MKGGQGIENLVNWFHLGLSLIIIDMIIYVSSSAGFEPVSKKTLIL